jgi:hypothetical protein
MPVFPLRRGPGPAAEALTFRTRRTPGTGGGRRRRRAGAVLVPLLAFGIALGGASVASALWGAQATPTTAVLRSGTFGLTATWSTAPTLTALFPGQTRDGVMTLQHTGNGTWRYRLTAADTGALGAVLTETFYAGATCTGTPLVVGALSATTYAKNASTQVCVRIALPAGAANTLQNATSAITVTATAESRRS